MVKLPQQGWLDGKSLGGQMVKIHNQWYMIISMIHGVLPRACKNTFECRCYQFEEQRACFGILKRLQGAYLKMRHDWWWEMKSNFFLNFFLINSKVDTIDQNYTYILSNCLNMQTLHMEYTGLGIEALK